MGMEVRTDEAKAGGFQRWNPLKRAKQLQDPCQVENKKRGWFPRFFRCNEFFFGFLSDIGMA